MSEYTYRVEQDAVGRPCVIQIDREQEQRRMARCDDVHLANLIAGLLNKRRLGKVLQHHGFTMPQPDQLFDRGGIL